MLSSIEEHLSGLPLGKIAYFDSVGSTNDVAAAWLTAGAPDLSIAIADEQTAGRGRKSRRWHTPPGTALAFSLLLHTPKDAPIWPFAPLGALAVHEALQQDLNLPAAIKWPNDVLTSGKKICGVLAEAHWQGANLCGVVLGIGVNVRPESLPALPLQFPATSIQEELGHPVDRWRVLSQILKHLLAWRNEIGTPTFLTSWEKRLAFRGQQVWLGKHVGVLHGLSADGKLLINTDEGQVAVAAGELSLRPNPPAEGERR